MIIILLKIPKTIIVNSNALLGLFNKFNNGAVIMNNSPKVDEIKKRGNRIKFSQKVGIKYKVVFVDYSYFY